MLLKREGRYIGPGHAGVFTEGGRDWLSFHYYDGEREGRRVMEAERKWTAEACCCMLRCTRPRLYRIFQSKGAR